MIKNAFVTNHVMVLPTCGMRPEQIEAVSTQLFSRAAGRGWEVKHQAFAAGFFGYHYVRAAMDDDIGLQMDSLEELKKSLRGLHVRSRYIDNLKLTEKPSYADFKDKFIHAVWLELGDSFSAPVKWMTVFGYQAAIILSCLVGAENSGSRTEISDLLSILKSRSAALLTIAEKADMSDRIAGELVRFRKLLDTSRSKRTLAKCRFLLASIVSDLLVTENARAVLS